VRIDVVDSGIGIAPGMRERIFEEFVQGGAAPRQAATGRGMGLGLAIVRRLAALLGHTISVASTPGRGSRFSVAAPRAIARRSRADGTRTEACATELVRAAPFEGRRVAVIDDDPAVVAAVRTLFEAWGASVLGGATAGDVLPRRAAAGGAPGTALDLVVADLRLGAGGCGLDAVAQVLAATSAHPAVLIVSGDTGEEARAAVAAAGFTLLAKPVVAARLQAAAIAALERA
jgi:CheY-like chemotaxis protein